MSESNLGSKPDKLNSQDIADQKRKRRHRSDEDGRNFSCNCGKSYLSYPALYTHIKTKHNGKAEFNRAPCSKSELEEQIKEQSSSQYQAQVKNMQTLRRYLNKLFPFIHKDKENEKKVRELTKEDQNYLKGIKDYWQKHKKQEELQLNDTYGTMIDQVFGKFLLEIQRDLSRNAQKFVQDFVINIRNGLNQLEKNEKFCRSNCAANIPAMMNELFNEVLQKQEDGHIYMKHPTIPCKVIYHFCRWLFSERFTNHSLKFNSL